MFNCIIEVLLKYIKIDKFNYECHINMKSYFKDMDQSDEHRKCIVTTFRDLHVPASTRRADARSYIG